MKTLLINPPFGEGYSVGASRSMRYVLNVIAPLGLAYLAAVLEKNDFYVRIIDCAVDVSDKGLFRDLLKEKPQIVGISATTPSFASARFIAGKIKELMPSAILVIGGSHVTAAPHQAMDSSCFDLAVIGEGEETFLELVRHIQAKGLAGLDKIKGIIYREDCKLIITPRREFITDLDSLPHPARHLLPALSQYKPTPASYKKLPLATIMSSRGCPSQCAFCDRSVFGNIYRQRSSEDTLAEIDEVISRWGAREIRFFDDVFTLDKERTYKICAGMKKRKILWTCMATANSVTKELLGEMRRGGCYQVLYGLESGDARMLKLLRKGADLEQNIKAITWTKEAGIGVRADFMVGAPGETLESLEKSLKFAIDMGVDYAYFNKFVPFPGTELYRQLCVQGHNFDFNQGSSIVDYSALAYAPPGIPENQYRAFLNRALKKFYLRPGYIVKRLLFIRTKDEFIGQLRGFFAIAGLSP